MATKYDVVPIPYYKERRHFFKNRKGDKHYLIELLPTVVANWADGNIYDDDIKFTGGLIYLLGHGYTLIIEGLESRLVLAPQDLLPNKIKEKARKKAVVSFMKRFPQWKHRTKDGCFVAKDIPVW